MPSGRPCKIPADDNARVNLLLNARSRVSALERGVTKLEAELKNGIVSESWRQHVNTCVSNIGAHARALQNMSQVINALIDVVTRLEALEQHAHLDGQVVFPRKVKAASLHKKNWCKE